MTNEIAGVNLYIGPPSTALNLCPPISNSTNELPSAGPVSNFETFNTLESGNTET